MMYASGMNTLKLQMMERGIYYDLSSEITRCLMHNEDETAAIILDAFGGLLESEETLDRGYWLRWVNVTWQIINGANSRDTF